MARSGNTAKEMFAAKGAGEVYSALVSKLQERLGAAQAVEDVKQTCVHITASKGGTAFAGLHPRKEALLLNIRLDSPLKSPRIRKVEQVSRNRCHCEMILSSPSDVDAEVLGWLEQAWSISSK